MGLHARFVQGCCKGEKTKDINVATSNGNVKRFAILHQRFHGRKLFSKVLHNLLAFKIHPLACHLSPSTIDKCKTVK